MYDTTNRESFNQLPNWLATARSLAPKHCVFMLIGNKIDEPNEREVTFLEASRFAQENGIYICIAYVFDLQFLIYSKRFIIY